MIRFKNAAIIIALLINISYKAQNSFGEISYFHSSASHLTSGTAVTNNSPGFLMGGYDVNCVNYNFVIDRTDKGGAITTNPNVFQREYDIYADVSGGCNPNQPPLVTSSHGVSVIETNPGVISSYYAFAASFDEALCVSFLTQNGSPINTNVFFIPFPATSQISRPKILEDPNNAANYFVCGSYNQNMIVKYTDISGNGWCMTYPIDGVPHDMVISPAGNLVVVGRSDLAGNADGFFMDINASNGLVNIFRAYDVAGLADEYGCITNRNSTGGGYLVGGRVETSAGAYKLFSTVFSSVGVISGVEYATQLQADINALGMKGITERLSGTWGYEYFGVTTTSVGIGVLRMNVNGMPTFINWNNPLDEYIYNAAGNDVHGVDITSYSVGTGYDEGLHIFGTDGNGTQDALYLIQSYFNGVSGCSSQTYKFSVANPTSILTTSVLTASNGPNICTAISITSSSLTSETPACGPVSSVQGGSNAKTVVAGLLNEAKNNDLKIYPNPSKNILTIENDRILHISLYNDLGQELLAVSGSSISDEKNIEINLQELNLISGIYNIKIETPDGLTYKKFNYQAD